MDVTQPLWKRYRAMFALRNLGTDDAVLAIADGKSSGAFVMKGRWDIESLFRPELRRQRPLPSRNRLRSGSVAVSVDRLSTDESFGSVGRELHGPA